MAPRGSAIAPDSGTGNRASPRSVLHSGELLAAPPFLLLTASCRVNGGEVVGGEGVVDGDSVDDTGVWDDTGEPDETGESHDTGADSGEDTAPDSSADTGIEYPLEPPEWPDCGTLSEPMDFAGDGFGAFFIVTYAMPGWVMPAFGLGSALSYASTGNCAGYLEAGEVRSFTGACETSGTTLSGEATVFYSWSSPDWWGTAAGFAYLNADGSGWEGDGAWASDETDGAYSWTAVGYDFTTAAPEWGPSAFRGGIDRDDGGWCARGACGARGYVHAIAMMDVYDGEFCYALAMAAGDYWTGPGVIRIVGTERIEIVLTGEASGFYTVDGGAPIAY